MRPTKPIFVYDLHFYQTYLCTKFGGIKPANPTSRDQKRSRNVLEAKSKTKNMIYDINLTSKNVSTDQITSKTICQSQSRDYLLLFIKVLRLHSIWHVCIICFRSILPILRRLKDFFIFWRNLKCFLSCDKAENKQEYIYFCENFIEHIPNIKHY